MRAKYECNFDYEFSFPIQRIKIHNFFIFTFLFLLISISFDMEKFNRTIHEMKKRDKYSNQMIYHKKFFFPIPLITRTSHSDSDRFLIGLNGEWADLELAFLLIKADSD